MTDEAVSPLRRPMIEDMTIRRLSPKTQQGYIRTIKSLAAFLGRSPDKASFEDIRRFQLHVAQSGVGTGALNATVTALRFFFRVTLKRYAIIEHTAFIHEPRKLPVVLSPEEMTRLLGAAPHNPRLLVILAGSRPTKAALVQKRRPRRNSCIGLPGPT
jgi:integrase/recombinase XerD